MSRSPLMMLCAGVVATVCFACSPPLSPVPPVAPSPPPAAPSASAGPRTCVFDQNKIVDLAITSPPFNAAQYGFCGVLGCMAVKPTAGSVSQYAPMIANAINTAASPKLQTDLCTLDKIYIDTDASSPNDDAWGMRELQNGNIRHIGLHTRLLSQLQASSAPLADYENIVLQHLLPPGQFSASTGQWLGDFKYFGASPDTANPPNLAFLAILAHEMGHILWVDKVQDMAAGCGNPDPIVHNKHFYSYSWPKKGYKFSYHTFGNIDYGVRPTRPQSLLTVQHDLNTNLVDKAEADLRTIYGGEWASLFATVAVDEDFVETYELSTLFDGQQPLTSLQVTMPSSSSINLPVDMAGHFANSSSRLYKKARWIAKCL
jgi:hypothetical protein